jgi:hypothetical protein
MRDRGGASLAGAASTDVFFASNGGRTEASARGARSGPRVAGRLGAAATPTRCRRRRALARADGAAYRSPGSAATPARGTRRAAPIWTLIVSASCKTIDCVRLMTLRTIDHITHVFSQLLT